MMNAIVMTGPGNTAFRKFRPARVRFWLKSGLWLFAVQTRRFLTAVIWNYGRPTFIPGHEFAGKVRAAKVSPSRRDRVAGAH